MRLLVVFSLATVYFTLGNGQNTTESGANLDSFAVTFLKNYIKCIEQKDNSTAALLKEYLPSESSGSESSNGANEPTGSSNGTSSGSTENGNATIGEGSTRSLGTSPKGSGSLGGPGGLERGLGGNAKTDGGLGGNLGVGDEDGVNATTNADRSDDLESESLKQSASFIKIPKKKGNSNSSTKRVNVRRSGGSAGGSKRDVGGNRVLGSKAGRNAKSGGRLDSYEGSAKETDDNESAPDGMRSVTGKCRGGKDGRYKAAKTGEKKKTPAGAAGKPRGRKSASQKDKKGSAKKRAGGSSSKSRGNTAENADSLGGSDRSAGESGSDGEMHASASKPGSDLLVLIVPVSIKLEGVRAELQPSSVSKKPRNYYDVFKKLEDKVKSYLD